MKGKIAVAFLTLSLSLSAPAAVKLANGDQLGPALDDVRISLSDNMNRALEVAQRRLGLTLAESQALIKAIQNGQSFGSAGDVDDAIKAFSGGSGGNGNGDSGANHVDKADYAVDKAAQAVRDQGQDDHINAVQGAAQTANDRATSLEGRADAVEGAVRETNTQLAVTDARSIDNAERLDGVEQVNDRQNGQIAGNKAAIEQEAQARVDGDASTLKSATGYTDGKVASEAQARADGDAKTLKDANSYTTSAVKAQADIQKGVDAKQDGAIATNAAAIKTETAVRSQQFTQLSAGVEQAQATGDYANARVDAANANIEANRQALTNTNKRVADNTAKLANHESRITSLEQETNSQFNDLRRQVDDNKRRADAGVAGVAAMANIPQVTESARFSVGAGVGTRGSEQAIAVGMSSRLSGNVVGKLSVAADTQSGWTAGAGVAVQW